MLTAILFAVQTGGLPLLDLDLRPPRVEEVQAAERRAAKQVPVIVQVCRAAVRSGDLDSYVKRFADRNGLSSYGRVALSTDCRVYHQGIKDGAR